MTEYEKLKEIIKDKNVLYIPIYSCFDYQTQKLNFKADGNINRFLSTFHHCNTYKSLSLLCPVGGNDFEWFLNTIHNFDILKSISLIYSPYIVKSAKIERSLDFANKVFYDETNYDKYDIIIVESQHLFMKFFVNGYKDKLVYWCPVCATNNKTRDFLEPYKELDRFIFSEAKWTIVASNDQVEYYKTITGKDPIQIEQLIDRQLSCFNYKVQNDIINEFAKFNNYHKIFLPFRLTDRGYQMQEIFDYLYNERRGNKPIKVFYSNPNNCDIYQFAKNNAYKKLFIDTTFIKVSKDRDTYYTIIDYCKVIIPYFEDTEFICHAAVDELKFANCVVCKNLEKFKSILN